MENKVFLSPNGQKITSKELLEWVLKAKMDSENEYELIVGSDSHLHGVNFRFITAICLYKKGKGGNYYLTQNYEPRSNYKGNQKGRMFQEVSYSIETSNWLMEQTKMKPIIHIDASPKHTKHFTSNFSDGLKGYAISAGYDCKIKPESFVANAVADRHTK